MGMIQNALLGAASSAGAAMSNIQQAEDNKVAVEDSNTQKQLSLLENESAQRTTKLDLHTATENYIKAGDAEDKARADYDNHHPRDKSGKFVKYDAEKMQTALDTATQQTTLAFNQMSAIGERFQLLKQRHAILSGKGIQNSPGYTSMMIDYDPKVKKGDK